MGETLSLTAQGPPGPHLCPSPALLLRCQQTRWSTSGVHGPGLGPRGTPLGGVSARGSCCCDPVAKGRGELQHRGAQWDPHARAAEGHCPRPTPPRAQPSPTCCRGSLGRGCNPSGVLRARGPPKIVVSGVPPYLLDAGAPRGAAAPALVPVTLGCRLEQQRVIGLGAQRQRPSVLLLQAGVSRGRAQLRGQRSPALRVRGPQQRLRAGEAAARVDRKSVV